MNRQRRLAAWDRQHVWHPFTQHNEWEAREPLIIDRGTGVYLHTADGRRLIDGASSLWVNVFGHAHPRLNRALSRQAAKIPHSTFLGLTHEPAILLARELVRISPPGLTRVFYSDNGSSAVEVALKMAYQYWQLRGAPKKTGFIAMEGGYHGDTLGAVSVGGVPLFHDRFRQMLFKVTHVRPGDATALEAILKRQARQTAALVLEPLIQGASGMRLVTPGYLAAAARLCRRYDVKLIVDEVATGFGRTGKMFAVEHENVAPDFLCVAKSLTAGYLPLAATLTREDIFDAFRGRYADFRTFFHGHTYTANPLACAVALENLKLYRQTGLLPRVRASARHLAERLKPLASHPHVKEVRQLGLMAGIELVANKGTGEAYRPGERKGLAVCDAALRHGVWLRPLGDVIVILPPLAIGLKELDAIVNALFKAIDEVL